MSLFEDVRHALRLFRRSPGLTSIALASIVITIGATSVVFTAVKSVLIAPLPYSNPDALVQIRTDFAHGGKPHADWVSWADMQDVRRNTRTFESLGIYRYALFNLTGDPNHAPEALYGLYVSADLFPTLGVKPMLGRNILTEETEAGREHEMILSYGLWTRRFNSDRNIVGRSVEVNGHQSVIIGVMPAEFAFPMRLATTARTPSDHMDFWAPESIDPGKAAHTRPDAGFGAVARLKPGVSIGQAQQDLASIGLQLQRLYPRDNGLQGRTLSLASLRARTLGFTRTGLLLLMGAAAIFMLIGCANVANLLLAKAIARNREIGVRLALGAGRVRIVRQLVTEACVLALAGGIVGYALTVFAWTLLPSVAPMSIPRLAAARADGTVFAFALAISILNGILFGIAPALRTARRDPALSLRESGSRGAIGSARNRLRSSLVVAEVALAVTLVVVGGLLTASFVRLLRTDPGFDADHVLASFIIASGDQYKTPQSRELLFRRVVEAVRVLPAVESAGTVNPLPFSGDNTGGIISTDTQHAGQDLVAEVDTVSADYLKTMGVRLLEGRWFREDDMLSSRDTAIVNDIAASRLWPGWSAVGRKLCINCGNDRVRQWKRVIGVVTSSHHAALEEPLGAEVYYAADAYQQSVVLVVRTHRPAAEVSKAIRAAVASVDPKQPVFLSATLSTLIGDSIADRRFVMTLLAITGSLALLLAAAGVYGVISYATSLRTQEIGVRMALGAAPSNVHSLIFRQGMLLAGAGAAIGLVLALTLTRILRTVLIGLTSLDAPVIALALTLVIVTASIACWVPARRATRVDPMLALRQD